jgi:hypothetical protein
VDRIYAPICKLNKKPHTESFGLFYKEKWSKPTKRKNLKNIRKTEKLSNTDIKNKEQISNSDSKKVRVLIKTSRNLL